MLTLVLALPKETSRSYALETYVRDTPCTPLRLVLLFVATHMALSCAHAVAPAAVPLGLKRSRRVVSHMPKEAPRTRIKAAPDAATMGESDTDAVKTGAAKIRAKFIGDCATELDCIDTARDLCSAAALAEWHIMLVSLDHRVRDDDVCM